MTSDNPFETPAHHGPLPIAPGRFDVEQCFREAKKVTFENPGLVIALLLVCGVVSLLSAVTVLGIFLVIPVLMFGFSRASLDLMEGKAELRQLFSGFSSYGSVIGPMLLCLVLSTAVSFVGNSVSWVGAAVDSSVLRGLGGLVQLAWALGVNLRFSFAQLFLVDKSLGAVEAMSASWNATKGQTGNLVLLMLASGLLAFVGLLALGIGLLVTMPMAWLMWVSAYRQMVGTQS